MSMEAKAACVCGKKLADADGYRCRCGRSLCSDCNLNQESGGCLGCKSKAPAEVKVSDAADRAVCVCGVLLTASNGHPCKCGRSLCPDCDEKRGSGECPACKAVAPTICPCGKQLVNPDAFHCKCGRSLCSECSLTQENGHCLACKSTAPAEFKLAGLTDRSRTFLYNVGGFLESKRVLDRTSEACLPHRWMDNHPSFAKPEKMIQKNLKGFRVESMEELLEVAALGKVKFDEIMRTIVTISELDPDEEVQVNGRPLMLNDTMVFRVLTMSPLKGKVRCMEKVKNEYDGDYARLIDIVRCSIIVFTEEQLESVAQFFHDDNTNLGYEVARLKNRFKTPLFNGYRDALYSIVVDCGDGIGHVCEVQLHLADVVAHKHTSHVFYEYFRGYFGGSGAEEKRMEALLKIRGFEQDPDRMLSAVLAGTDVEQLRLLGDLVGTLMGDVQVAVLVQKRLTDLVGSFESKANYATALYREGKYAEAEVVSREALAGLRKHFGDTHKNTMAAINNLGALLSAQGKFQEAETLYREALSSKRKKLGDVHPDTFTSMNNLGALLKTRGKHVEAEKLYQEALAGRRQQLGNTHPHTLASINNLGTLFQAQNKFTEAEVLAREALIGYRQQLGSSHRSTLAAINNLGTLLKAQGKLDEAEVLTREALVVKRQQLGSAHASTVKSVVNLAALLKEQGKYDEALTLYQEAVDIRRKLWGDNHPDTKRSALALERFIRDRGKQKQKDAMSESEAEQSEA